MASSDRRTRFRADLQQATWDGERWETGFTNHPFASQHPAATQHWSGILIRCVSRRNRPRHPCQPRGACSLPAVRPEIGSCEASGRGRRAAGKRLSGRNGTVALPRRDENRCAAVGCSRCVARRRSVGSADAAHREASRNRPSARRHAKRVALGRRQILRTVGYGTQPGNAAACFTHVAICASSNWSSSWMSR